MHVSGLYFYPMKSGKAVSLQQAPLETTGILNDRRWVLVDIGGRFVTQRELPMLGRILLESSEVLLTVRWGEDSVVVNRPSSDVPPTPKKQVTVWKDQVLAQDCGDEIADFLSLKLGRSLRLYEAYEPRVISNPDIPTGNSHYLFADSYPFMILGQGSLDGLNRRLKDKNLDPLILERFRPNIVIDGLEPHSEDEIDSLRIGDHVELRFGKLCSRCNIVNIDPFTHEVSSEPLKTLATYRKIEGNKIYFGVNMWLSSGHGSAIHVGDPVHITLRNKPS